MDNRLGVGEEREKWRWRGEIKGEEERGGREGKGVGMERERGKEKKQEESRKGILYDWVGELVQIRQRQRQDIGHETVPSVSPLAVGMYLHTHDYVVGRVREVFLW